MIQLCLILATRPGADWRDTPPYCEETERTPDGRRKVYPALIVVDGVKLRPRGWDDEGEPMYVEAE